jgi:hypothetical protein
MSGAQDPSQRSLDPCPRCGQHRLAVIDVPDLELTDYQIANQTLGIQTDVRLEGPPGIECLDCGAAWSSVEELRADLAAGRSADADER